MAYNPFSGPGFFEKLGYQLGITGPAAQQRQMMRNQRKSQRIQQCNMRCQQKTQQCAQDCQGGFFSFLRGGTSRGGTRKGGRGGTRKGGSGYRTQLADFYQAAPFSGADTAQPKSLVNGSELIQQAGKKRRHSKKTRRHRG